METDVAPNSDEIMFAVFDGEKEITDVMYEEVMEFVAFLKQQEGYNK